jgi:FeS assembly protein IscX
MLWTDIYEIVDELIEKHSETDPEKILFVDLRKMVIDWMVLPMTQTDQMKRY